jgi:uncharacterized membrane protein
LTLLVIGLAVFLGTHLIPAVPPLRRALVARWGDRRYRSLFALASAAGLVAIVVGFGHADRQTRLFAPFPAAIALARLAIPVALILLVAANLRGYLRHFVRHPMLAGVLIWSTVHLFANGDLAGTVLFGAFLAWAAVDLASAVGRGAVKPFAPRLAHDAIAVGAGIAATVVFMLLHRVLFGVAIVPFGF